MGNWWGSNTPIGEMGERKLTVKELYIYEICFRLIYFRTGTINHQAHKLCMQVSTSETETI